MKNDNLLYFVLSLALFFGACSTPPTKMSTTSKENIKVVNLTNGTQNDFESLRSSFAQRNPGYDISHFREITQLNHTDVNRVLFVQGGSGTVTLDNEESSKFTVGEIILLEKGRSFTTDSLISVVAFIVPEKFPPNVPIFIRPDWDENITDTPGGCATETNAYRRILLTWLNKVGPYQFHALNAHRVRIMDSFSHYHPEEGGFDEFYLVQMAQPNARLITSNRLDLINHPNQIKKDQLKDLIQVTPLHVGDLIYIPRGIIHRGLDGVLAQVITVPGFIPGSEIGVDHHLRAINEKFNLTGEERLPFHESASKKAVVK